MSLFEITILGQPVPWQRPRKNKNVFYDPQYIAKKNFAWAVKEKFYYEILKKPFILILIYCLQIPKSLSHKKQASLNAKPHNKRPDLSNYIKFTEDALNGICWLDDCLISSIHASKLWSYEPKTIITTEDINP